ncbi:MAG: RCC1 domain-containing protein, partial [Myxococcota bacterium]
MARRTSDAVCAGWTLFGAFVVVLGAGCSGSFDVEVQFDNADSQARAVRVEVAVVNSCTDQLPGLAPIGLLRSTEVRGGVAEPLGSIEHGRYGLYARAIDASCSVVAAGCTPIRVNESSSTFVVELADEALALCPPTQCASEGRCLPVDGGVRVDGAVDGDVGASDAGDGDAGECEALEDQVPSFTPSGRISNGRTYACVVREDRLFCFGDRSTARRYGADGCTSDDGCIAEIAHPDDGAWRQISVGYRHACAIDTGDQLYCFGVNDSFQLGDANEDDDFLVKPVGFGIA